MIRLAILIPVFNGIEYTKKCLESLKYQISKAVSDDFSVDVVVCDDGSKDGTADWIKKNTPWVHLVFGDGNLWWSGGINKGTEYALKKLNADYLLWWNNDILAKDNYFIELKRILLGEGQNVIPGSKIFFKDATNIIWSMGGYFNPKNGEKHMIARDKPDDESYLKPREVDWFPGMGTSFHKSVFEKCGMLDEVNFPQYHGDLDFTYRAKLAGYTLITFPQLIIYNDTTNTGRLHDNSFKQLFKSLSDQKSLYNLRKDLLLYRKYTTSVLAYKTLFIKYFKYIGGFFKWQLLQLFGKRKK